jgi:hypothetical protein
LGTKNEKGTGDWRNCIMRAEFVTTYHSGVKPRTMRWTGYVARMGRRQINAYKILVGKSDSKNHLEDIRVNGRMELNGP